jgi:hypothetical protein
MGAVGREAMSVTYTNRKGITYTLCQGMTKTGKPRYTFVRDPEGKSVVVAIPEGWKISESVNGIVSLVKLRHQKLLPREIAAVESEVGRHSKASNYRINLKSDRIEVYESVGTDVDGVLSLLERVEMLPKSKEADLRDVLARRAQFTPVLRFILDDQETRVFRAERWRRSGNRGYWLLVSKGPAEQLARQLIPALGTHKFSELF